jgi:Fic family protein
MARRMASFIHELDGWPQLHWSHEQVAAPLAAARHEQGRLIGQLEALGFKVREDAVLRALTDEVVKSGEIEGEKLEADQVRSSLARRLGLDIAGLKPADRYVDGVVEMMLDATQRHDQVLTADRLFGWHAALFPSGRSGMRRVRVGGWRDDRPARCRSCRAPLAANECISSPLRPSG